MFTVGVLGEYLSIIFDEVKERPEFIVSKTINILENNETETNS